MGKKGPRDPRLPASAIPWRGLIPLVSVSLAAAGRAEPDTAYLSPPRVAREGAGWPRILSGHDVFKALRLVVTVAGGVPR